jgi:ankyrin repeat protein
MLLNVYVVLVQIFDWNGSALIRVSLYGHIDVVKCLLTCSSDADVNLCDDDGQSPFVASMYEQCDVVKCLLSSEADINLCDKQGQSPLFVAINGRTL